MRADRSPLGRFPRRTARWVAVLAWIACLIAAVKIVIDVVNNEFEFIYVILMLLCFGLAVAYTVIWRHAKLESTDD